MYGHSDDRSRPQVQVFHLQAETDWGVPCAEDCPSCDLTSNANRLNLARAYDRLKGIIPTSSKTPTASTPSAPVPVSGTATTGDKKKSMTSIRRGLTAEEQDYDQAIRASHERQRLGIMPAESMRTDVHSLVDHHDEFTSIHVI